ncbi:MAG: hypothetical protein KAW09_06510 [Thermoplasmata archaeon]|nr:hypothetical protein [Thermoplasmata archaeon]
MDGKECQLTQVRRLAYRHKRSIVAEIKAQAREHGITLPDIFIHINRDGSLALATGAPPHVWPEGMIMVRSVEEINITNWQATGSTVPIPQYQFDLEIKWTDNEGNPHVHTGTYRYPNDIASMPLNVRRRYAEEMVIATVRVTLGINEWSDYS